MGIFDRIGGAIRSSLLGTGSHPVHVGDPRFEDWEVVREFGEVETARAFADRVRESGLDAELTSDWPLDQFGRGEIYLQVPPGQWSEAEAILSGLDPD